MNQRVCNMLLPSCVVLAVLYAATPAGAQTVSLFSENFESLVLGPIVTFDSERRSLAAWTDTAPPGWIVDDTGVPTVGNPNTGVTEYEGWSFVSRDWWIASAGDQQRSEFIGGQGIVAVADPDEWDDFGDPAPEDVGLYDAKLKTPFISLAGAPVGQDIKIFFNSSWRPEDDQKASLTATFNDPGSTQLQLLRFESDDDSPFYKDDATNEAVLIPLVDNSGSGGQDFRVPAGATAMQLEFRVFDAGNDWWWAFDNLQVFTGDNPPSGGALKAVIDREFDTVKIVNETGDPVELRGYSIRSAAGVFDEAAADFMAPANNWLKATKLGDESNDLSELNLTSYVLGDGEEINFGDVWEKFYRDLSDVSFEYLVVGSDDPIPGIVQFTGNDDESYDFLDLNYDGTIDIGDWTAFKAGFGRNLEGKTEAQRYNLSDLDNDSKHTARDFLLFKNTFETANGGGSFAAALAGPQVPEPSALGLMGMALAGLLWTRRRGLGAATAIVLLFGLGGSASAQQTLFAENFENADLGPFIEEDVDGQENWTNTYPGWTNNNSGVPGIGDPDTDGVVDWASWAFVRKEAWFEAEDQGRSAFTRGAGNVMVADPDEWDDADGDLRTQIAAASNPDNLYDVHVTTPVIPIPAGIPAGRIKLSFDSSWRGDEFQDDPLDVGAQKGQNNQTALINVKYGAGPKQEVFRRESDPESPTYDPYQENERISQVDLLYDGVSTSLQLEFSLIDAWNDWWWAIDNITVSVPSNPLKLRINTFNGQGFLLGDDVIQTSINYLAIESENGVLTGQFASGLSGANLPAVDGPDPGDVKGDFPGERWENLSDPETMDRLIAEAFLFGTTAFDNQDSISLGRIFDVSTLQADRDVRFSYTLSTGDIVEVPMESIEYFFDDSVRLDGDYNLDNTVNAADYTVWRDTLGLMVPNGTGADGDGDGHITRLDYGIWKSHYGDTLGGGGGLASQSNTVPEPAGLALSLCAIVGLLSAWRRRMPPVLSALVIGTSLIGTQANAFTLDRDYSFGDDDDEHAANNQLVGSGSINGATFDSATFDGGANQLIDLLPKGANSAVRPRYITVSDRPDMLPGSNVVAAPGLGIALNPFPTGSLFNQQYLHTGFTEALNFPERSPSSSFSPGGTINYDLVSDRGFQLWAKPTAVTESHIVMDTNQHGVLINSEGKFAMRYAYDQAVIDQLASASGQPASEFDDIFDYPSDVTAQAGQWYHLSVVRSFGPGSGSILYINGIAKAAVTGEYLVEEVVTDDMGEPDLSQLDTSPLVVGASTGNPSFGQDKYFRGIVDDLEMFVMGQNADHYFGEFEFEFDNEYAAAFKPTTPGDLNGDGDVGVSDAMAFANNWLFEKRVYWTDRQNMEHYLVVGDLESRSKGDFNYDGVTDLADWAILHNQNPGMGGLALRLINGYSIPEPSAVVLAVLGAAIVAVRRSGRTTRSCGAIQVRLYDSANVAI